MRAIRIIALATGALALSACASVLGIEEQTFDGADASAGGSAGAGGGAGGGGGADAGAGGGGGHAGDASVEGGGGSAGDAASEQAGGSGGAGGATADAGDAGGSGGSGGSGGCTGTTCSLPNATGSCTGGNCKIAQCALHYGDCDGVDSNGCEASLWTDPENCNGCGNKCSASNGAPTCDSGACTISCSAGFGDCDGDVANGCERSITDDVANCGGCNAACTVANGTPTCTGTTCGVEACSSPFADCDGQYGNGCETNLSTSATDCGACGVACTNANGTSSCTNGACKPVCSGGYGDCDGNVNNGCETDTATSASNCGQCGKQCSTGQSCVGGTCAAPPSCTGGATGQSDCGPSSNESCCTSLPVPGGTVELDSTHTATVSDYKLDKYEITVGRFRAFVDAVVGGWTPAAGSGKHTHLNGGSGLSNGSGGYEPGWDTSWNTNLPSTKAAWDGTSYLSCDSMYQTWTSAAGGNERRPINCVSWYQAEAFCIWDGGFLPSEAEWQYAAAGGSENRMYPWGVTAPTDALAVYCGGSCSSTQNVGSKPVGNGKWGQSDLAGNVWEWALDWYKNPYPLSISTNYANTTSASDRVYRGGSFISNASYLLASLRNSNTPSFRDLDLGGRCARTP